MHGNNTDNTSFLDVCLSLKQNIFRTLNVAEVCIVREIKDNKYKCEYINNNNSYFECICLQNVTVQINDVVLIVFTNTNFGKSLNAIQNNAEKTNVSLNVYHELTNGIIVGIIYRPEA